MKLYKANVIFTPTPQAFKIIPNGYVAVRDNGTVEDVYEQLPEQYSESEISEWAK